MKSRLLLILCSISLFCQVVSAQTSGVYWLAFDIGFEGQGSVSGVILKSVLGQSFADTTRQQIYRVGSGFLADTLVRKVVFSAWIPVSVERLDGLPTVYSLTQNYPNPFNPSTVIAYDIASKSSATLKVYNILGQELATLVAEKLEPGRYRARWDAHLQPSGVYFYRLVAGSFVETKKMLLLR